MSNHNAAAPSSSSLQRAQINLVQATQRYNTAFEQHKAGCLALFARLRAEGLLYLPEALRSGPCTLETARAYDASEVKWEEVQALKAQLDDAVEAMFRRSSGP